MNNHLGSMPAVPKHSRELQRAVEDDNRRKEIDSAKKHAAAQNVDYESFAALVSMAHIKPFERKRGQQGKSANHIRPLPAWSLDASGSLGSSASTLSEVSHLSKTGNLCMRAEQEDSLVAMGSSSLGLKAKRMTTDCFKREWRRFGTNFQKRLAFLLALSPDELPRIFKVELPPSVLSDVVEVLYWWKDFLPQRRANAAPVLLNSNSDAEGIPTGRVSDMSAGEDCPILQFFDGHHVVQILKSLCACGRFSLSLKLAGKRVLRVLWYGK
ncbi:hypothetical protein GOP47_0024613 [Adiantum capillus-veneris]|uniref:Uncharacterized protein n=1 Tax=Adiantum capillus-veneris TaxID=13818 RepID=A0A9D4U2F3_ADICA|nr:hypothetical protein GOP47_0024613 [Adiantum capillus-veneris]